MNRIVLLKRCKECGNQDYSIHTSKPHLSAYETIRAETMFRVGVDTRSIADRLGKSEAAVYNSLHRWREMKRKNVVPA